MRLRSKLLLTLSMFGLVAVSSGAEFGRFDPVEIEPFVDGILTEQMESDHIAGATVTIVHEGRIVMEKGYGDADVDQDIPVTPDTLFRIGSITKLFTWVSVMQLVEAGQIDLDADINTYIDFEVPAAFDEAPITMRHLMSHTAGFEDGTYGLEAADVTGLKRNGEWLKIHLPARIYPPGETLAYSNYGTALAGYIVERISGQPYAAYVANEIFDPLGMTQSSMAQPLPGRLTPNLAKPYSYADAQFVEGPFELFHPAPAGAGSISGHDMGIFMLAMLDQGDGILQPETVDQMFTPLFRLDPDINGYAYGWMEYNQRGERIIGHAGDTAYFHSFMILLPDREMGLFVSYNTAHVAFQPYRLADGLIDRMVSSSSPAVADPAPAIELDQYAGTYRMARRNETSPEKLLQLASTFSLSVDRERHELVLSGFTGEDRFKAVSPTVFQAVDRPHQLAFRLDADGQPIGAMLSNIPMTVLEPMAWYETPTFTLMTLGSVLILYLATLVAGVVDWVQRRVEERPILRIKRWYRLPVYLLILLSIGLLLGFALPLSNMLSVMTGSVSLYTYLIAVPWLIAAVTLWTFYAGWQVWTADDGSVHLLERLHFGLLIAAAFYFMWWMTFWRFFAGMPPT